jgi:hypothetical protein
MSEQPGAQTSVRRPDGGGVEIVAVFDNADESPDVPTPLRRVTRRPGNISAASCRPARGDPEFRKVVVAATSAPNAAVLAHDHANELSDGWATLWTALCARARARVKEGAGCPASRTPRHARGTPSPLHAAGTQRAPVLLRACARG